MSGIQFATEHYGTPQWMKWCGAMSSATRLNTILPNLSKINNPPNGVVIEQPSDQHPLVLAEQSIEHVLSHTAGFYLFSF